ncbi:uncharacterized protein BP01DRAFT_355191 [Aspergillus saccharolyticus JOP 1030-1]|uniref:Uncharacterized protein n=1 Tax=Aspergillus saccharolyticus JOP 1030-1 TaxID=1450539 RepID=A0A319A3U0_9EURO|nr:hypothetical protein BP01DRAFT_355191 [Aspergillus saccharolyticus JOP 1030-1]PYH46798.1 hypothetical protein BP01DRAFT_355191 [Aspergillus saccharolyticus JOP 1030-1]
MGSWLEWSVELLFSSLGLLTLALAARTLISSHDSAQGGEQAPVPSVDPLRLGRKA